MSEPTLEEKLAYLESEMAAIKAEIEGRDRPVIDASYIGHVVEFRSYDDEWIEGVLVHIDSSEDFPYRSPECGWRQCRPRQKGPSVGHWIEHDGSLDKPIDSNEFVVLILDSGASYVGLARYPRWANVKRYAIIKIG